MKRAILMMFLLATSALGGQYKVHYNVRGSGRDIVVSADSSSQARYTVQDMFPSAIVTGVSKKK